MQSNIIKHAKRNLNQDERSAARQSRNQRQGVQRVQRAQRGSAGSAVVRTSEFRLIFTGTLSLRVRVRPSPRHLQLFSLRLKDFAVGRFDDPFDLSLNSLWRWAND